MLYYFLIGLSFVLLGIVGLQFTYMFYLDRMHIERKKYLQDLEHRHADLERKLSQAETRIAEIEATYPELKREDESWAEVIDER